MAYDAHDLHEDLIARSEKLAQSSNRGTRGRGRGGGGKSGGRAEMGRDVAISKALSKLLRHDAVKEGLVLDGEGYARLDQVVGLAFFHFLICFVCVSREGLTPEYHSVFAMPCMGVKVRGFAATWACITCNMGCPCRPCGYRHLCSKWSHGCLAVVLELSKSCLS